MKFIATTCLPLVCAAALLSAREKDADLPAAVQTAAASMKWEHLALQRDAAKQFSDPEFARQINKLGDQGWELVNVLNFTKEGTTTRTVYYFKRPKN